MISITKGPLTANGTLSFDVRGFFAHHFSFYPRDSNGGGIIAIEAGISGNVAPARLINPLDGTFIAHVASGLGLHNMEMPCEQIDFVLTGATAPNLFITLFPEQDR